MTRIFLFLFFPVSSALSASEKSEACVPRVRGLCLSAKRLVFYEVKHKCLSRQRLASDGRGRGWTVGG